MEKNKTCSHNHVEEIYLRNAYANKKNIFTQRWWLSLKGVLQEVGFGQNSKYLRLSKTLKLKNDNCFKCLFPCLFEKGSFKVTICTSKGLPFTFPRPQDLRAQHALVSTKPLRALSLRPCARISSLQMQVHRPCRLILYSPSAY